MSVAALNAGAPGPEGVYLQRVQLVKGRVDAAGQTHERELENPGCRWSTRQCQAVGVDPFASHCAVQASAANAIAREHGASGAVHDKRCRAREAEPLHSPAIQERARISLAWYVPPAPKP